MTEPSDPRFTLFAYWRTSATYRVRVALNLKGLHDQVEERLVDIDKNEQRGAEFLKVNPLGAIPAMIDHAAPKVAGKEPAVLTQSLAILEYLDEVQPSPPLLPKDALGRARVRSIAAMLAGDTHPLITPRIKKYLVTNAHFDDAMWKAWQTQWFSTGLQAVEERLQNEAESGAFAHGDSVTMADVCIASIFVVMRVFKIEVPNVPTLNRIVASCEELEAFAKADPRRQVGAPAA